MTAMLRPEFSGMRTLNHKGHEGSRRKLNHSLSPQARNSRAQDHRPQSLSSQVSATRSFRLQLSWCFCSRRWNPVAS